MGSTLVLPLAVCLVCKKSFVLRQICFFFRIYFLFTIFLRKIIIGASTFNGHMKDLPSKTMNLEFKNYEKVILGKKF